MKWRQVLISYRRFIFAGCGNARTLGPEMPASEIIAMVLKISCSMDFTSPFDDINHPRYRILRWYGDHPVNMIRPKVALKKIGTLSELQGA